MQRESLALLIRPGTREKRRVTIGRYLATPPASRIRLRAKAFTTRCDLLNCLRNVGSTVGPASTKLVGEKISAASYDVQHKCADVFMATFGAHLSQSG